MYSEFRDDMVEKFKGKDYFMMMDEATGVCGRSVCGASIGTFDAVVKPELVDLAPETSLKFKNAPIANAETERVFSKMSALLTPQRLLTFKLKFHLMINWNCSEYFHNE